MIPITIDGITCSVSMHSLVISGIRPCLLSERYTPINTPKGILKKGESKLIINTSQERIEHVILSNPEDLANKLKEFGLKEGIKSIEIKQETLEEIMLSEINKNVS